MVNILDNLRAGYGVLCERVRIALRTQVGDENRLQHHIAEVGNFANAVEIVCIMIYIYDFHSIRHIACKCYTCPRARGYKRIIK